eukprot:TRINITY_DN9697_c0_g1_i1.p1 TRINITY_DN9697_c0_g1~~TRINITY_DN9697_c0_g1_i1.p1  ORF type:complete len:330 (-),score=65.50 TRINITY_DN9697_c0_g1_i1:47-1036(-)
MASPGSESEKIGLYQLATEESWSPPWEAKAMDIEGLEEEFDEEEESEEEINLQQKTTCLSSPSRMSYDYAKETYQYLRDAEAKMISDNTGYSFSVQTSIGYEAFSTLIDWIIEVSIFYRIETQTLFLSADYVCRYLSRKEVTKRTLQLVGVASLLVASKYEEEQALSVNDMIYISADTYTRKEVLAIERDILATLEFRLSVPTIKNFLDLFLLFADLLEDRNLYFFTHYLAEMCLAYYKFWEYPRSMVAASIVCLGLNLIKRTTWSHPLTILTRYHVTQLDCCITDISRLLAMAPNLPLKTVYRKYASPKYLRVSKVFSVNEEQNTLQI